MSEIMRCVFEKREPVRNVTALALMQYACEEFPRSRVDVVGMDNFMDKPSMGDDDILWSVEEREDDVVFTLVDRGSLTPDGVRAFVYKASSGFVRRNMDYQMVEAMLSACVRGTFAKDMLVSECLRVLRIVNRANTLSRRYGWRTRWLPLPSVEPLPYPEWRAYFADPTKPDFAFEHIQAHNV